MANENGPRLQIVASNPSTEAREPSVEELLAVAKELGIDLNLKELEHPAAALTRQMLVDVWKKQEEERRETENTRRMLAEQEELKDKLKKLNAALHQKLHPPKKEVLLTKDEIRQIAPAREPTAEERLLELKKQFGHLFPSWIFDHESTTNIMGSRGYLIGVLNQFKTDLHREKDEETRKLLDDKCRTLQNRINAITKIIRDGHLIDPTDSKNYVSKDEFKTVRAMIQSDQQLLELCSPPPSKNEREAAKRREAEEAARRKAEEEARQQMVDALVARMMTIDFFKKQGQSTQSIAKRIAKKFSGSTPESKLKQAAREKAGGDISPENRSLGIALAEAAKCTADEIAAMFPGKKKDKKNK